MKIFKNNEKYMRHEFRYAGGGCNSKVFIAQQILSDYISLYFENNL